jgi:hypothetical protein
MTHDSTVWLQLTRDSVQCTTVMIKIDMKEIACGSMAWLQLAQHRSSVPRW